MGFRAALFDFEGTLVDFQWKLFEGEAALRARFSALGFPEALLDGLSYSGMWNAAVDHPEQPVSLEELRRSVGPVYDEYDIDALSRWQLRPAAASVLAGLRETGVRTAVVSNIGREALDRAVQRFGLGELLEVVLSRDEVRQMKPAAEGIERCLDAWGISPAEALFVGDSLTDVRAARAAGVRVAVVAGGESSAEALRAEPPDYHVGSLVEVAGVLSQ